jgi:hypothetical protein
MRVMGDVQFDGIGGVRAGGAEHDRERPGSEQRRDDAAERVQAQRIKALTLSGGRRDRLALQTTFPAADTSFVDAVRDCIAGDELVEDADAAGASAEARLAECDDRLAAVAADVTAFRSELAGIREAYDALLEVVDQRKTAAAEAESRLSSLGEERAAVEQRFEEVAAALSDAETRAANHALRATFLERELETARALLDEYGSSRVEPGQSKPARHVRLVSLARGYALVEADESVPPVGALIDLGGVLFIVDGVGRSPLPGDRRECAFLLPVGSPLPPSSEDAAGDVADSSEQQHQT